MQCDFDTIGTRSLASDVETALVIHDLLLAIGFADFTIRINNRQVLNGLLERLQLADQATPILRALDKLHKIGADQVAAEIEATAGATADQARDVLKLASLTGPNDQVLAQLRPLVAGSPVGEEGLERLSGVLTAARAAGVPEARLVLDVSIARGLDYYTGTIFETFLDALPAIGSVCSGGRYDNLAGLYTSQSLPGIGASLGLDRLLAAMEELGQIDRVATPAPVLLAYFVESRLVDYVRLASQLRAAGIGVELYPDAKKLGQQLKYADRRGFLIAIIAGDDEFNARQCQIKNLATGISVTAPLDPDAQGVVAAIRQMLGG
jgi:histidyl-tRNA synthetase